MNRSSHAEKKKKLSRTQIADRFLCRPVFGIPFFFAVLSLIFFLSFGGIGNAIERVLYALLLRYGDAAAIAMIRLGVSDLAVRYLIDGIYGAFASAVAFLPQTVIFFLLIRALDDCGYLSRAIFVTDRFFRVFGLSGKAVIPLILGYGCAVSSVCVCDCENEHENAVLCALPFIPCNARLPVLLFLADSFFPNGKILFAVFILALSLALVFLSLVTASCRKQIRRLPSIPLPKYRLPEPRRLIREITDKSREYIIRALFAVLLCSAVFSALAMLTPSLRPTEDVTQSVLYLTAERISVIFRPLGFGRGEMAAALIFGFFAKENMVCIFRLLTKNDLSSLLTPAAAVSFTAFSMFYAPCASLLLTVSRKGKTKRALTLLFRTFAVAYTLSLILHALFLIIWKHC